MDRHVFSSLSDDRNSAFCITVYKECRRPCFVNSGRAVPRTTAMALSDTFITLLNHISSCEGTGAILPLTPGLQEATLTFMGKAVNTEVARLAEVRHTDIRILLSLS